MPAQEPVSSVLKRRVVKPSEQRRKEILDAANGLFAERGFSETTVEDIAQAAGVAKGTIYLYFQSKEHILVALKQRFMQGLIDALTDVIADSVERFSAGEGVDYRDVIDEIFDELVRYHCDRRADLDVVVRQSPGPDLVAETLALESDFLALLTNAFREGKQFDLIDTADPEMFARLINAAIRDTLCTCLCYGEPDDLDALVAASKELLYKALAPSVEFPPRRPRLVRPIRG